MWYFVERSNSNLGIKANEWIFQEIIFIASHQFLRGENTHLILCPFAPCGPETNRKTNVSFSLSSSAANKSEKPSRAIFHFPRVLCSLSPFVYFPVCRMKKIFRYYDHHNRIMCFIHCNKFALSKCAKARSRLPRGRARGLSFSVHSGKSVLAGKLVMLERAERHWNTVEVWTIVQICAFLTNFRRLSTLNVLHVKQLHTFRRFCCTNRGKQSTAIAR